MKTNQKTAQTPKELLHDLEALAAEAQAMIGNAATEYSEDAMSALCARFEAARTRLAELYAGARGKIVASAKSTDQAVRANPYQSLAIALGVGLLMGALIARRSK